MLLITFLISTALLAFCSKDEVLTDIEGAENEIELVTKSRNFKPNAQVIVLAAPSIKNQYYKTVFQDIVDFQIDFANKIDDHDDVIILVDRQTRIYYTGKVPEYALVNADFSPVVAGRQIKFIYRPEYLSRSNANYIDNSFEIWFRKKGLRYGNTSVLILDGGNVVDNGKGRVIITDRFLYDNPQLTKRQAKNKLKRLLKAKEVAVIKEIPGDATGHSDGMVMWTEDNTLLLHDQPAEVKNKIIRELKISFPGVKIVIVPDFYQFEEWGGFSSACNIYVNSLVTNNFIYVPTFNDPHDNEMLNFIRANTTKEVIEIPAEKVCFMGGSVRCLSWQLDGQFADEILHEG